MKGDAPDVPRAGHGSGLWLAASGAVAMLVALPIAGLIVPAWQRSESLWQHLAAYVLPAAAGDTLLLLAGVGLLTIAIGTTTAWLVTAYEFPGRRIVDWALLLPLAVPTYIVAYAYLDLLHPVGPVQTTLRALLGYGGPRDFRLPDIRTMTGCIVMLGFVLYPYVYLPTRAMFAMQSANIIDVARTLGMSRRQVFFRVAVPLARPAVVVGASLALMEALNDIGASEFLGVRTLTVAIYSTWVARSDLAGATQIALGMLVLVVSLVLVERWARRQRRFANDAQHPRPLARHHLAGMSGLAALGAGLVPVAIGFVAPAAYLLDATLERIGFAGLSPALLVEARNAVVLSVVATVLTVGCAIAVMYAVRLSGTRVSSSFARIASLGYAIPGTVLAIGLLPLVTGLDRLIDSTATAVAGVSTGLLVLGSGTAVIYAYVVRFLAVAAGGVEAGFSRVPLSLDEAARTLGETAGRRLQRIHLPLARPALGTAAILVFVDCMKELPATLLLRPIGFETLATHLYGEAVRGTYEDAAIAALMIVAVGLVPVLVLARIGGGRETGVGRGQGKNESARNGTGGEGQGWQADQVILG